MSSVINEPTVDGKHALLVKGVYTFFAAECGTKELGKKHGRRQSKLAQRLREAKKLKRQARRE